MYSQRHETTEVKFAYALAYQLLGQEDPVKSLAEYNSAVRSANQGQFRAAIESYLRSIELDVELLWASNNVAWLLATYPDGRARDGAAAVRHATVACDKSDWHCWNFIDTVSAAYVEAGDFTRAVTTAERATAFAPEGEWPTIQANLRRFRAKQPVRQN